MQWLLREVNSNYLEWHIISSLMLPPFSHSPRHTNATRIVLASVEENGEKSSSKGGDERPHSQSGSTLEQYAIHTRNAGEHCGCLVGVPAATGTRFFSDQQWFLFSIILRAFEEDSRLMGSQQLHSVRSQGAERSQRANECSTPKTLLLLSRHTGMRGHERTRPLPLLGAQLNASFFTLSLCLEYCSSFLSEKVICFKLDSVKYLPGSMVKMGNASRDRTFQNQKVIHYWQTIEWQLYVMLYTWMPSSWAYIYFFKLSFRTRPDGVCLNNWEAETGGL